MRVRIRVCLRACTGVVACVFDHCAYVSVCVCVCACMYEWGCVCDCDYDCACTCACACAYACVYAVKTTNIAFELSFQKMIELVT